MSRALDDLCPRFRPMAYELLARCAARRVWCIVLDTLRTKEEQAEYLKAGTSKTQNSLHLPQTSCSWCGHVGGLSHAMDAAPIADLQAVSLVGKIQWDSKHPAWKIYGEEAHRLQLIWGGDWGWDYSHTQMPRTVYSSATPQLGA